MNFNNKTFKALNNSDNGEVGNDTLFHYRQEGNIIWATYGGGSIQFGTITGFIDENNHLHFRYQHLNAKNKFMTGKCSSIPSLNENNKIILTETWQWTCKDFSKGSSILVEI